MSLFTSPSISFVSCSLAVLFVIVVAQSHGAQPLGSEASSEIVKYVRFCLGGDISFGIVKGEQVQRIEGDLFGQWKATDSTVPLNQIEILVPSIPSKVIALAGNYRDHLGEVPIPEHPEPFFKVPSCLVPHEAKVRLPATTENVHHEIELVVVIGRQARDVAENEALDYVLGVTCGNDISARLWQKGDKQWWRAKGADTFGPCGPFIVSGLDYNNLDVELRVNGEVRQESNTRHQIHNVAQTVSFLSRHITLEPGDLIYTGTPGKTRPLSAGDVVEVEIEGIGILRNHVVAE